MSTRSRSGLVALGANLGDRRATLTAALEHLAADPRLQLLRASSLYETDPVGGEPQPPYLNACALFETTLGPADLLARLLALEARFGRVRTTPAAPRLLDLDLLLLGGLILDTRELTLPHPRMCARHFVLVPAAEIAPDLLHPRRGDSLRALLQQLGPPRGLELLHPPEAWAPPAWSAGPERRDSLG